MPLIEPVNKTSRRGPLSKFEREYIKENGGSITPEKIGQHINRSTNVILSFLNENHIVFKDGEAQRTISQEFKSSNTFRMLQKEFSDDELAYIEERYIELCEQFKGDVFASEKQQIIKSLKYEVLMNRNLAGRKEASIKILELRKKIKKIGDKYKMESDITDTDKDLLSGLDTTILMLESKIGQYTGEFVSFEKQHQALMNDLKGTRQQRIAKIENTKRDFIAVIRELQNDEIRDREGRQLELMKRVVSAEKVKLSKPHQFGEEKELPLLNEETANNIKEK